MMVQQPTPLSILIFQYFHCHHPIRIVGMEGKGHHLIPMEGRDINQFLSNSRGEHGREGTPSNPLPKNEALKWA